MSDNSSKLPTDGPLEADDLLPLVYHELRKLAASRLADERIDLTLQATALVHEAYLRLLGNVDQPTTWANRAHFFAAASEAMRRILVESARRRTRDKHGGNVTRVDADFAELPALETRDPAEIIAIHDALDRLAERSHRKAELVKLRYFAGCTLAEAADILGISHAVAETDWTYARAWLRRELLRGTSGEFEEK